jgi:hypothetical protein
MVIDLREGFEFVLALPGDKMIRVSIAPMDAPPPAPPVKKKPEKKPTSRKIKELLGEK